MLCNSDGDGDGDDGDDDGDGDLDGVDCLLLVRRLSDQ
jgi:hypothetical protein